MSDNGEPFIAGYVAGIVTVLVALLLLKSC
jgi:hypothetical protein